MRLVRAMRPFGGGAQILLSEAGPSATGMLMDHVLSAPSFHCPGTRHVMDRMNAYYGYRIHTDRDR